MAQSTWICIALAAPSLLLLPGTRTLAQQQPVTSTLQVIAVNGKQLHSVYTASGFLEAPNWTRDGSQLVFDQGGSLFQVPPSGGVPTKIDIGPDMRCNGSHGFSPDGNFFAISCSTPKFPMSRVYSVPAQGGIPRVVTERPNSYFHSWSPDGKTILFTRPDHGSINIFSVPAAGGEEHALTNGTGVSDDPDFSPDGKYIYFNSDRNGGMQIWRMAPDGSAPEQMTAGDLVNWSPHPSPDGKWIVFITYAAGTTGHPANQPVALRLLSTSDRKVQELTRLVGGAGTMNVPSWSPDGHRLAFVSFQVPSQP